MPKLWSAVPCFAVADFAATMRWYETELGFSGDPFPDAEPFLFAIVRRDEVEIMLQRVEDYQKPDLYRLRSVGVWDTYLRVEGVKELYESLRDKLEVKTPLRKQPYGQWEFEVKDPNGYILVFSELIE